MENMIEIKTQNGKTIDIINNIDIAHVLFVERAKLGKRKRKYFRDMWSSFILFIFF